jgi:hypothetical protein
LKSTRNNNNNVRKTTQNKRRQNNKNNNNTTTNKKDDGGGSRAHSKATIVATRSQISNKTSESYASESMTQTPKSNNNNNKDHQQQSCKDQSKDKGIKRSESLKSKANQSETSDDESSSE